jgi:hypothetical protein
MRRLHLTSKRRAKIVEQDYTPTDATSWLNEMTLIPHRKVSVARGLLSCLRGFDGMPKSLAAARAAREDLRLIWRSSHCHHEAPCSI